MARLSWRIQRFELVSVAILVILLALAASLAREHLAALSVPAACFAELLSAGPLSESECVALALRFFAIDNREAIPVMQAMSLAPLVAGMLLGVGLVSREVETGTAALAWALSGSRVRWLAARMLPVMAALIVLLAVLAVVSDGLLAARQPWVAQGRSLVDLDGHGGILILRGVIAFLLAVLVGAVVGRTLPSVIVATVVVAVAGLLGASLANWWLQGHVTYVTQRVDSVSLPGGYSFGSMSRGADGVVVSDEVALSNAPPGEDPTMWVVEHYENVQAVVPGTAYPDYLAVEALAGSSVAVVIVVCLLVTIERRRPL